MLGLDDCRQNGVDRVDLCEGVCGDEKKTVGKEGLVLYGERERTMGESKIPRVKNGARCRRPVC